MASEIYGVPSLSPFGRTLDWIKFFDPRSRKFRANGVLPRGAKPRSYTWAVGQWLDQGTEGACVGFAWSHEAAAKPAVNPVTEGFAREIYYAAQRLDEWPGEGYSGTSVIAGAKAMLARGYFREYRWCFSVEEMLLAVGNTGPCVLGVDWHRSMLEPDSDGFITPAGGKVGGHAILCYGVNIKRQYFKLWNSWGPRWGRAGTCYLTFEHMQFLFDSLGECCVPVGRRVVSGLPR